MWAARTGRIVRRHPIGGRSALAPDGHTLALVLDRNPAMRGSSVALLDLRSGRRTDLAADLPDEWIDQLAFTSDGARIVGGSAKGLHVWDAASGAIAESFRGASAARLPASCSTGRGSAITGAGVGTVGAWDIGGTQRLGRRFRWGPNESGCFANPCTVAAPRGALMATAQSGGTVALVDASSGRLVHTFPARNGELAPATRLQPRRPQARSRAAGPGP